MPPQLVLHEGIAQGVPSAEDQLKQLTNNLLLNQMLKNMENGF